jgi:hypothetical protein
MGNGVRFDNRMTNKNSFTYFNKEKTVFGITGVSNLN